MWPWRSIHSALLLGKRDENSPRPGVPTGSLCPIFLDNCSHFFFESWCSDNPALIIQGGWEALGKWAPGGQMDDMRFTLPLLQFRSKYTQKWACIQSLSPMQVVFRVGISVWACVVAPVWDPRDQMPSWMDSSTGRFIIQLEPSGAGQYTVESLGLALGLSPTSHYLCSASHSSKAMKLAMLDLCKHESK